MHEHRREEDDGGVEVEHGGDGRDEREQRKQQAAPTERRPGEPCPECLEQSVVRCYRTDQEQAGDEDEGRPGLCGSR